jgi:hypothetical protein
MAVPTASCDDISSLGLSVKFEWTCRACLTGTGRNSWTSDEPRPTFCVNPNHVAHLDRWMGLFRHRSIRFEAAELLACRAESLCCEVGTREMKAMLFDFVHKPVTAANPYIAIVKRLGELERHGARVALALAAWKALAESEAADQPIEQKAKKLKTLGQVRAFAKKNRGNWRIHLKSIAESGHVQLVARLVSLWHS